MRLRPDVLIPIETEVLVAAKVLRDRGAPENYGYLVARQIWGRSGSALVARGGTVVGSQGWFVSESR